MGIKILGVGSFKMLENPEWVVEYDPDTPDRFEYPTGNVVSDVDPAKAKRFSSHNEAFDFSMQTSKNVPTRPDGAPNRPLRAFTLEITEIPE